MAPRICDALGLIFCLRLIIDSGQGYSDFLPIQADFHLKKAAHLASPPIMDNVAFENLIQKTFEPFTQNAATNGAKITYEVYWNSSSAGAFTLRKDQGKTWHILIYDGMLRLPYATEDMISSVLCHELGHHLGGYPFKENTWSASEGQADFFSFHACLPKLFAKDLEKNKGFREKAPLSLRKECDLAYGEQARRDICYRSAVAAETLLKYEGQGGKSNLSLVSKDPAIVKETIFTHPAPQCRIDTVVAGLLCQKDFKLGYIPGHFGKGLNTLEAEKDSSQYVCQNNLIGSRPHCWFRSLEN